MGRGPVMPIPLGKGAPFIAGKGFVGVPPMLAKGGFLPGKGFVMGSPGAQVAAAAAMQQAGQRRSWSPHAGSRAIRQCYKDGKVHPQEEAVSVGVPSSKSSVKSKSTSSSRGGSSKSSKSSKKKNKKKAKHKAKLKKGQLRSKSGSKSKSSTISSSTSSGKKKRSRSRSRKRRDGGGGNTADAAGSLLKDPEEGGKETKEIEEAKLEALKNLTKLQSIEPKEQRAKEWRLLLRNWHPDKNPDNVEVATAVFQFLQKGKQLLNLAS